MFYLILSLVQLFYKKMSEIINKFNILRDFPSNLRQHIKSFHVSREPLLGYCVLDVNKVYGLGKRIHEILGYNENSVKYVLINELNGKNIIEFYNGYEYMFARNNENEIFSWGWNYDGQLARGYRSEFIEYLKPEKISFFNEKNIIEISCSRCHCLALSSDGRVFGWGNNSGGQLGCVKSKTGCISTPIEIDFKEKIKFIHCTWFKSFALSFDGNAYYWGRFDNLSAIITPKLISMKNVLKVYCDSRDIISILDNNGKVFEFNALNEEIIEIKSQVKFNDFYCEQYGDYCILKSDQCIHQLVKGSKDEMNTKLIKTNSINFYDFYSQNSLIYEKTIEITKEGYFMIKELHFDYNNKILSLKYENIFDKKYENLFNEKRKIGQGVFGSVYEAKKKSNNILYAIKMMEIRDKSDLNEIRIMSELNKDFVVQYIDSWIEGNIVRTETKPFLYIQMELCEQNLREFNELIKKTFEEKFKTFQYFISCELFKELIECVNYLHSRNPPIIHRDLKPENILISEGINGRFLKLCDFGISKIHEISNHTRMKGTLKYMAPEVLNSTTYNTKADIYSLALIATEIFKFEDNIEIIRNHKNQNNFDKYLTKYLKTILETQFKKLLKTLSNCLLPEDNYFIIKVPKDYHSRLDCKQLLENYEEFFIDKSIVLNDKNISDIMSILKNHKILKRFFERKRKCITIK